MKQKITFTLIFILILIGKLNAQWTQLNSPTGSKYCWAVERVGNEIWAAYDFGIYVSTNEGATWSHHPDLWYPTMDIKTIGDTIILLIQENPSTSLYKLSTMTSYDGGITWNTPVTVESGNSYYLYSYRELFVTDTSIIVKCDNYYVSYNVGQTWSAMNLNGNSPNIWAHTNKFLLYTTYLQSASAAYYYATYYSDNGGTNWNLLDSNYAVSNVQMSLIIDSTFYIPVYYTDSITHSFIARTSDYGVTWDTLALNLFNSTTTYIQSFNNKIYYFSFTASYQLVSYQSSDGGNTWIPSQLPSELFWTTDDESVLLSNGEWLINCNAYTTNSLYHYNDASHFYFKTETGINARAISFLKNNNGVLFAKADDKLITSNDAGITWNDLPLFLDINFDFCFIGDTILGKTVGNNGQNKMCYSYNNGITWDSVQFVNGAHWVNPTGVRKINNRLYANNMNYVAYSDDWGLSWDSISTVVDSLCGGQFASMYVQSFEVCSDQLIIYDNSNMCIAKLDTTSLTWKAKLCLWLPGVNYTWISSLGNKIAFTARGGTNYFRVSNDLGNTWTTPTNTSWPDKIPYRISLIDGIWFSTNGGNIYYSMNYGNSWQQYPTANHMKVATGVNSGNILTTLNSILYAGGNGIWRNIDTLHVITGNVYFDNNNNGTKDINENGIANHLLYTFPYNIAFNADTSGNYSFLTAAVGDTLRPALPTNFCSSNPPYYLTNGAASNVNFGIYFQPGIQDLSIDITNTNHFRPGFNTNVEVTATNNGTVAITAQLEVQLDSNLTYISSSVTPTQIIGNTLYFTTDTLQLLESEKISIQTQTGFMTAFGTAIICDATINPLAGDTIVANNYSQFTDTVVASFDPNEKSCTSGPYFLPAQVQNGDEMIYTIRFQNLGNFQADNVSIVDTLSELFDYSSFRIISSSHNMHYSFAGNGKVTFFFDNIFLPAAINDEPGSHGYVKFAVKFKATVSIGSAVVNTAFIFFDFNPAIVTNTVTTTVANPLLNVSSLEIKKGDKLLVYPNPANSVLNIAINYPNTKGYRFCIYNQLGEIIKTANHLPNRFEMNVADFTNGLYFGKIILPGSTEQWGFKFIIAH